MARSPNDGEKVSRPDSPDRREMTEDQRSQSSQQDQLPAGNIGSVLEHQPLVDDQPPDGGFWAWMCGETDHEVAIQASLTLSSFRNTSRGNEHLVGHFRPETEHCHFLWLALPTDTHRSIRGVINTFGVFQSYHVETLGRSPSDISWIGSIEIFLLFFVGALAGRLTDAGYFHHMMVLGSFLVVIGTMTTSVSRQYWQLILSQGVCVGLGNGFIFAPAVAITSTYFKRWRSIAIGISACGSSTGGIIYPLMVRQLLPRIGFGWTTRTIGFLQAFTLIIAISCIQPRKLHRQVGPWIDWTAFQEPHYLMYAMASILVSLCS